MGSTINTLKRTAFGTHDITSSEESTTESIRSSAASEDEPVQEVPVPPTPANSPKDDDLKAAISQSRIEYEFGTGGDAEVRAAIALSQYEHATCRGIISNYDEDEEMRWALRLSKLELANTSTVSLNDGASDERRSSESVFM
jgi:hypothetical protein